MRLNSVWKVGAAVLGLHGSFSTAFPFQAAEDPSPLTREHPGDLSDAISSGLGRGTRPVTSGNSSAGFFKDINGINTYLVYPRDMKTDRAVLFLTDIFGVQFVNNRLLADNFARAGYFVAAPDLFKADPVGINQLSDPTFSFADWNSKHPQVVIDGIIDSIISALQSQFGSKKIAAAGYCFGGKFVTRHLAPGNGLDVGFTAHPSNVLDAEYQAVANPLSIAFGDLDTANPPAARASAESILRASNIAFQTSLYSNAEHGFAVRTNLSDPQKKFAQESAYYQAVRFFDTWM